MLNLVGHIHFHVFRDSTTTCHYLLDPLPIELTIFSSHVPSAYLMSDIRPLTRTAAGSEVGIEGWKRQRGPTGGHK